MSKFLSFPVNKLWFNISELSFHFRDWSTLASVTILMNQSP